jgi:hypothetical protein
VGASPARKLLLPAPAEGWAWAGVEPWNDEAAISQIVHAVRQTLRGEPLHPLRPVAPLAVVGTIIGVILLLLAALIVAVLVINLA